MNLDTESGGTHGPVMTALTKREANPGHPIDELDRVRLLTRVGEFPEGSEGTVVHLFKSGAMLAEFSETVEGLLEVEPEQVARLD